MRNLIYNFDWDDNIMFMKTRIWYFHKNPEEAEKKGLPVEVPVSTETFRFTRKEVSVKNSYGYYKVSKNKIKEVTKSEKGAIKVSYKDYDILDPERDNTLSEDKHSFREFRDSLEVNYFLDDLKVSLKEKLFGPSWDDFVECCSHHESSKKMTIITARGHSPRAIYEGLKYLQSKGHIKYIPRKKHIFPVSYQGKGIDKAFVGTANNPSEAKKNVMLKVLDMYQLKAAECDRENLREVGFSDDDHHTIETIKDFISLHVAKGRWPNLKIVLFFTGNKVKEPMILSKTKEIELTTV